MPGSAERRDDAARGGRLRAKREVSGAKRRGGRRAAQHEPRRRHAVPLLGGEYAMHTGPDRVPGDRRHRGRRHAGGEAGLPLPQQLGQAERRECRPCGHDIDIVRHGGAPAVPIGPWGEHADWARPGGLHDRLAQSRTRHRDHRLTLDPGRDERVYGRRRAAIAIACGGRLFDTRARDGSDCPQQGPRHGHRPVRDDDHSGEIGDRIRATPHHRRRHGCGGVQRHDLGTVARPATGRLASSAPGTDSSTTRRDRSTSTLSP